MAQIRQRRRSGIGRRPHWSFALGVACLLTTGLALVAPTPAAAAVNVVVNSVGDAPDATPGDGSCETATAGECTLRAAIEETNAIAGADTIGFAIPGSGVHRIAPLDVLPFLGQVTIDGYTQPGATPNTLARGSNAVLQIELHGGAVPTVSDRFGLVVTAPGSVIRGLVINGYGNNGSAIYANNAPGLVIEGNFVGTNAAGTAAVPNYHGIRIDDPTGNAGAPYRVGGTAPAQRNVISGNVFGISGWRQGSVGLTVEGNLIGTDATGTAVIGNSTGVLTLGAFADAVVGGTTPGAGNVISGNVIGVNIRESRASVLGNLIGTDVTGLLPLGNTVAINVINEYGFFPSTFALPPAAIGDGTAAGRNVIAASVGDAIQVASLRVDVRGNYIGVGADGTTPLGNGGGGILIGVPGWGLTGPSTVGGPNPGDGNIIANGGSYGVTVQAPWTGHRIIGNSIRNNAGSGIDLGTASTADGPTLNHVGSIAGPNNYQNFPVVSLAAVTPTSVRVVGALEGVAGQNIEIDVYRSNACDASTFGEGETHLGRFPVTFAANGKVEFDQTLPVTGSVRRLYHRHGYRSGAHRWHVRVLLLRARVYSQHQLGERPTNRDGRRTGLGAGGCAEDHHSTPGEVVQVPGAARCQGAGRVHRPAGQHGEPSSRPEPDLQRADQPLQRRCARRRGRRLRLSPVGLVAVGVVAIGLASLRLAPLGLARVGHVAVGLAAVGLAPLRLAAVGLAPIRLAPIRFAAVRLAAVGLAAVGLVAHGHAAVWQLAVRLAAIGLVAVGIGAVRRAAVG